MVLIFGSQSCNDFDELNNDPTKWTKVDPNNQLTYVQLLTWGDWAPNYTYFSYQSSFVQQLQGEWNATNFGGLYKKDNERQKMLWDAIYTNPLKNIIDILSNTEGKPQYENIRAVARIFKVYNFMLLTDTYGDIPYFEGAKGYAELISTPAYDKQEVIYKDFLKELKEAEMTLGEGGGLITGDIIYNGDINKWKRFANSLRLRVAMRMVYAEPQLAKDEVLEILLSSSGLILPNEDALVTYIDINSWEGTEFRRNALSQSWRSRETYPNQTICSTFWNFLRDSKDPRIFRIARCYVDLEGAKNDPWKRLDVTDEIMELKGWTYFQPVMPGYTKWEKWPMGYNSPLAKKYLAIECRPQISNDFLKGDSPGVLMTYAETQLLLAEAKVRWSELFSDANTAEQYYKNGVTASMNLLLKYGVKSYSNTEISDYFTANPFPTTMEDEIKTINEQLWVLHFTNPPEAYANWRRSRYPVLKPSSEYGKITFQSDIIPTRLTYPFEESSYNKESQKVALDAMGGTDDWNARVWWDKK